MVECVQRYMIWVLFLPLYVKFYIFIFNRKKVWRLGSVSSVWAQRALCYCSVRNSTDEGKRHTDFSFCPDRFSSPTLTSLMPRQVAFKSLVQPSDRTITIFRFCY